MIRNRKALIFIIFLLLTGCSPFVGEDQPRFSGSEIALQADQTIGQTFVARNDGLNGIQIRLHTTGYADGKLFLHLRSEPRANTDLAFSEHTIQSISDADLYSFSIPTQMDSHQQYYYIFWEFEGEGTIWVTTAEGETYLDGALYLDHEPLDQQLTFILTYEPKYTILGFIKELIKWAGILVIGIFLYVTPGLALLSFLWPSKEQSNIIVRICIAIGLSLAIYPILFLWTDLMGLHLGPLYAWLPPILGSIILLWRLWSWGKTDSVKNHLLSWIHSENLWPDSTLFLITALAFLVRFISVRTIDVPMWGDSYQHTMIAQLMVDNKGLFDSWEPYAPLTSFTYHFGFHSHVAIFEWVTGRSAIRSTLWVGQILNGLAVLTIYPMALKIGKHKWAGVLAVLVAGLLSPMPNYYTNWGRYTQLVGLCILPIAIFLAWSLVERQKKPWNLFIMGWILFAGLALTHYRVLVFAMAFFPVILVQSLLHKKFKRLLKQISLLALGAILLFLPWLIHIWSSITIQTFGTLLRTSANSTSTFNQLYNTIGDISNFLPIYLWLLLVISISYSLWKNNHEALTIILWSGLILILANPAWLNLPGTGALSNFAVFISAYLLSALLIGAGAGWALHSPQKTWIQPIVILTILISIPHGFNNRYKEIETTSHSLVTKPDLRAAAWIRENTNKSTQFLVNGFVAYGGTIVVGSDAGWWLPLTANRRNTVPPINYVSEQSDLNDFPNFVNTLYDTFRRLDINDLDFIRELKARGITHVYIGQREGTVNYSGSQVIQPDTMLLEDNYDLIYHEDNVWIFQIR